MYLKDHFDSNEFEELKRHWCDEFSKVVTDESTGLSYQCRKKLFDFEDSVLNVWNNKGEILGWFRFTNGMHGSNDYYPAVVFYSKFDQWTDLGESESEHLSLYHGGELSVTKLSEMVIKAYERRGLYVKLPKND